MMRASGCCHAVGLVLAIVAVANPARAESIQRGLSCTEFVGEAARTAGLPEEWLAAVMRAESSGDPSAISSAGARGCMQVMPSTWHDLQLRGVAGPDPFDPRANMIGGAVYLRAMYDRYGWPDALAAYHAGAGRFEDYLATRHQLPTATLAYVDRISSWLGQGGSAMVVSHTVRPFKSWAEAPVFIADNTNRQNADGGPHGSSTSVPVAGETVRSSLERVEKIAPDTIFVVHRP